MTGFVDVYDGAYGRTVMIRIVNTDAVRAFCCGLSGLADGTHIHYNIGSVVRCGRNGNRRAVCETRTAGDGISFEPGRNFVWAAPAEYWKAVLDAIDLIDLNHGGHQYFETEDSKTKEIICIKISLMEL